MGVDPQLPQSTATRTHMLLMFVRPSANKEALRRRTYEPSSSCIFNVVDWWEPSRVNDSLSPSFNVVLDNDAHHATGLLTGFSLHAQ